MLSDYAESFSRDVGGTAEDWLARLPDAIGAHPWERVSDYEVTVWLNATPVQRLRIRWETQPPRRIAMMSLPRLRVHFDFSGADPPAIREFMQRFDLHMQRGGG